MNLPWISLCLDRQCPPHIFKAFDAPDCVETFSGGAFTDEVREVYMELLSRNVSLENCSHVVHTILERLGKLKVGSPFVLL